MKTPCLVLLLIWSSVSIAADAPPPVATDAQTPPPASPPKRSAADLEKLVGPIALYSDPLIATILPASVYPLEIVQAARFVADTNNLAKLDEQPWDDNVKAVARIPGAIKKLNEDISWTIELGEAFLAQDKDVMDAVQSMRAKAQKAGTLQTTEQQIVTVTNMVVEKTVEEKVVVVTNTVVQIEPASSSVVYVPTYSPAAVYYPPPAYVYNPVAPLVTFTAGVAMGAIIANNCDWHGGGCYHSDVDIDVDRNVNRNVNRNTNRSASGARASSTGTGKKWQPDQSRLNKSGAPNAASSARSSEARGWGSGGAGSSAKAGAAGRSSPSTSNFGGRSSTGAGAGTGAARPSAGTASASRPSASSSASRPSASPSSASRSSASSSRPSSSGSAFGGSSSGAGASSFSNRGASSRSSGGSSGARSGGGGGGRGGGGGGRR